MKTKFIIIALAFLIAAPWVGYSKNVTVEKTKNNSSNILVAGIGTSPSRG